MPGRGGENGAQEEMRPEVVSSGGGGSYGLPDNYFPPDLAGLPTHSFTQRWVLPCSRLQGAAVNPGLEALTSQGLPLGFYKLSPLCAS